MLEFHVRSKDAKIPKLELGLSGMVRLNIPLVICSFVQQMLVEAPLVCETHKGGYCVFFSGRHFGTFALNE